MRNTEIATLRKSCKKITRKEFSLAQVGRRPSDTILSNRGDELMKRMLHDILAGGRRKRAEEARKTLKPRSVEIHSITPQPADRPEGRTPDFLRVAFVFLDPPGPYSLQFYEAATGQDAVVGKLPPGTKARYYESRDEAHTRLIETEEGEPVWPR